MDKEKTITIAGKQYPCRLTMGALVRFKRATGLDIQMINNNSDIETIMQLVYACVASASVADGVDFQTDFLTFADLMPLDALEHTFASLVNQNQIPEQTKKKPVK